MSSDLVFVDVEATGLFSSDRVVSLAAIRVQSDKILQPTLEATYCHFVFDPGKKSHPRAEAVHGLDDWFLRHQPQFSEQSDELSTIFTGSPVIVAHNIAFDRQFLLREFELANLPLDISGCSCTMDAYRQQEMGRASLDAILPRIGLRRSFKHHGAFEDAWLSLQVYRWLHGAVPLKYTEDWPPFSNVRPVPPRPDILPHQSRRRKSEPSLASAPTKLTPLIGLIELRPIALILDYIARSDGRIESEIAVLTDFLLSERPDIARDVIPEIVASWVDAEAPLSVVRAALQSVRDREKLAELIRRVVYADGTVSQAEVQAMRDILS